MSEINNRKNKEISIVVQVDVHTGTCVYDVRT
jgi:hypothetical protein